MENENYWEDEEYKESLKCYSEFDQMCSNLNQFSYKDQWAFDKRNWYANKMNEVKKKYIN